MKKSITIVLIIILLLAVGVMLTSCGKKEEPQQTMISTKTDTSEDPITPDPGKVEVEDGEDVSTDTLKAVQDAKEGTLETLSGKYALEGTEQTYYIFDGKGYILKEGTYEPQGSKIILPILSSTFSLKFQ